MYVGELKMAAPSEEKLICDKFNLEALTVNQVKFNRNPWLAKMCLSGRSYSWQLRLESSHIASVLSRFTLSPAHSGNLLSINNH
jgi:hypothetical protein